MYGCYYEAYQNNSDFVACLNGNGHTDRDKHSRSLDQYFPMDKSGFSEIADNYFIQLVQDRSLDNFMQLRPEEFLESDNHGDYSVNMHHLRAASNTFLDEHECTYRNLMEKYESLMTALEAAEEAEDAE